MAEKQKQMTKNTLYAELAEKTELTKKKVGEVFEELATIVKHQLGKKGPGVITIPNMLRIKMATKPATKAREGRNPATGEKIMIKAKPARKVTRAKLLKAFEEQCK